MKTSLNKFEIKEHVIRNVTGKAPSEETITWNSNELSQKLRLKPSI
jgi:hypothetical protein